MRPALPARSVRAARVPTVRRAGDDHMADAAGRLSVRPGLVGAGAPEAARRRRAGLSLALKRGLAIVALFGTWELLTGGFGGVIRPAVNPALFPPPSLATADLV